MPENMALRITFGPMREEVSEGWRKLHNGELHNLYASPNIVRVNKSRRMRWAGHVARMGDTHTIFWLQNLKASDQAEDLSVGTKIILEWILAK
jgi:hypothetical protein